MADFRNNYLAHSAVRLQ